MQTSDISSLLCNEFSASRERNRRARNRYVAYAALMAVSTAIKLVLL